MGTIHHKLGQFVLVFIQQRNGKNTVLILDGNLEIDAHINSNLWNHIYLRHLIRLSAVTYQIYLWKNQFFHNACATCSELPSYINTRGVTLSLVICYFFKTNKHITENNNWIKFFCYQYLKFKNIYGSNLDNINLNATFFSWKIDSFIRLIKTRFT